MARAGKLRWGDTLDDDDALPPPHISTKDNVKTVVEYYRNDKGDSIKKTTKYKVVTVQKKVFQVSRRLLTCSQHGSVTCTRLCLH